MPAPLYMFQPKLTISPIQLDGNGEDFINGLMFLRMYCSLEIPNPNLLVLILEGESKPTNDGIVQAIAP